MALVTFPLAWNKATACRIDMISQTGLFPSFLTGSIQTTERGGHLWQLAASFVADLTDAGTLRAFIAEMRGQANRVLVTPPDLDQQGAYGGTPLVNGASQTGDSLVINGASNNITNWARAGDYISFPNGTWNELKLVTADANSDGAGNVTLSIEPVIRNSPADAAAVEVTTPTGQFLMSDSTMGWNSRPAAQGPVSFFDFILLEDLFG